MPHSRTVLAEEDIDAAVQVLRSGQLVESDVTRELGQVASGFLGRRYAWAAPGGTAAVHAALRCMGVGAGDEVLLPTYVCDDVLSAVLQSGARPVPVDLDPEDLNPDPEGARTRAGPRARAIVLAHTIGMPARVAAFKQTGIPLVEDCAHGLGAALPTGPAGSEGACTVLSFHGLKMITAGEGGMVLTDEPAYAERLRRLHHPDFAAGEYRPYSRMSNVLAAIAIRQFGRLGETVELRRRLAARYGTALAGLPKAKPVLTEADDGRRSSCYRFALVIDESLGFEEVERRFLEREVIVRRPIKQLCHRALGMDPGGYPQAERLFDRIVSLPLFPDLTEEEQDRVIAAAWDVLG